jgi:hypothetical protein
VNGDGRPDLALAREDIWVLFAGDHVSPVHLMDEAQTTLRVVPEPAEPPGPRARGIGDVNGDGLADLALWETDGFATRISVLFGQEDPGVLLEADLRQGVGGFAVGEPPLLDERIVSDVTAIGSLDGDDLAEWAIGMVGVEGPPGRTYVIRGKADGAPIGLADLEDGVGGFVLQSAGTFNGGRGLASGDLDGDGRPDLLVGETFSERVSAVVDDVGPGLNVLDDLLAGGQAFALKGAADMGLGHALAPLGDLDGDGRTDFIVTEFGDYWFFPSPTEGKIWWIRGAPLTGTNPISTVAFATLPGEAKEDAFGDAIAGVGDFDGDGLPDTVIAAGLADHAGEDAGRVYYVSGAAILAAVAPGGVSHGHQ